MAARAVAAPEAALPEGQVLIDGDIVIADADPATSDLTVPSPPAAAKLDAQLWEDGVLPIVFVGSFSAAQKQMVFDACAVWSHAADVRCVEGPYKGRELDVVQLIPNACWCLLGMGRNFGVLQRTMNLADGCFQLATVIHELGHGLGLIHEHQRTDRDQFVRIHPENVAGNFLGLQVRVNFGKQKAREQVTPYDFRSIMHYSRRAFSKNGKDTIVPRPGYEQFIDVMGHVPTVSAADAAYMAYLYGPPKTGSATPATAESPAAAPADALSE
jgi:hypothetical protein